MRKIGFTDRFEKLLAQRKSKSIHDLVHDPDPLWLRILNGLHYILFYGGVFCAAWLVAQVFHLGPILLLFLAEIDFMVFGYFVPILSKSYEYIRISIFRDFVIFYLFFRRRFESLVYRMMGKEIIRFEPIVSRRITRKGKILF